MRYLIIADIHSNLEAFKAVLKHVNTRGGFNQILCLGDVIGYGPEPHECLDLLRQFNHLCIAGNHDLAAVGKIETTDFNGDAAIANSWTAQQLCIEDQEYIKLLKLQLEINGITLVHGSLRDPTWEYLLSTSSATANIHLLNTPLCFVGHSHVPIVFTRSNDIVCHQLLSDGESLPLISDKMIVNPGSVGQPRDGDSRASYALYDSDEKTIYHYRVAYDIEAIQKKMKQLELPSFLISRLSYGQ